MKNLSLPDRRRSSSPPKDRPAGVARLRATPYATPPRQIFILIVALQRRPQGIEDPFRRQRPYRSLIQVTARQPRQGSGSMRSMIVALLPPARRLSSTSLRPIAPARIPRLIWQVLPATCRPMPMLATISSIPRTVLPRLPAGHISGAIYWISTQPSRHR